MKGMILPALLFLITSSCQRTLEQARRELAELRVEFRQGVFHPSVENGDAVVVELFLTAGMNPDLVDDDGLTPLMKAASNGHLNVARVLLNSGARTETQTGFRIAALDMAAERGRTAMVKLLVEAGAKIINPSVLAKVKRKGYTEIAELFGPIVLSAADHEILAISSVRDIVSGQIAYSAPTGAGSYASDLEVLSTQWLVVGALRSGTNHGYSFRVVGSSKSFTVNATPLAYGSSGTRSFFSDPTGVIRYTSEDRRASAQDPPL